MMHLATNGDKKNVSITKNANGKIVVSKNKDCSYIYYSSHTIKPTPYTLRYMGKTHNITLCTREAFNFYDDEWPDKKPKDTVSIHPTIALNLNDKPDDKDEGLCLFVPTQNKHLIDLLFMFPSLDEMLKLINSEDESEQLEAVAHYDNVMHVMMILYCDFIKIADNLADYDKNITFSMCKGSLTL
jgi:hypothetical protein